MNGADALIALARAFETAGLPYMIVGSHLSNFYGIPRLTKDADLVINLDEGDWKKLPSILPEGMGLEQQSGFEMVTSIRKELIRLKNSVFEIELFQHSKDAHDSLRFNRRHKVSIIPGVEAGSPPPRMSSSRNSVGAEGPARLDWPYIEEWCEKHGTLDLLAEVKAEAACAWEDE